MKKKLLFIIPGFHDGGAERVFVNIINYINNNFYQDFLITIICFDDKGPNKKFLGPNFKIIDLEKRNSRVPSLTLILKLIKWYKTIEPDVVISFLWYANVISLIAKMFTKVKVIVSERSCPSLDLKNESMAFIKWHLVKNTYRNADHIIAISNGVKKDLVNNFNLIDNKISVIYNPLDILMVNQMSREPINEISINNLIDEPIFISVGRLTQAKDYPTLIRAFALYRKNNNQGILLILGQGEQEKELKTIVNSLEIKNNVLFLGHIDNPYKFMRIASVLVLSSVWEGFGNVIVEAMALGVPVISTDCKYGPGEIITHRKNGLLVEVGDDDKIAKYMELIVEDEGFTDKLRKETIKRAQDFSINDIVNQYVQVINGIISNGES